MPRDEALLLDIYLAAQEATEFVNDIEWEVFEFSKLHQNAVIRSLEVIGEAAKLVSEGTRSKLPEIPWPVVVRMRNRLIHEYFRVNLRIVWDTVKNDLPPLIEILSKAVAKDD